MTLLDKVCIGLLGSLLVMIMVWLALVSHSVVIGLLAMMLGVLFALLD